MQFLVTEDSFKFIFSVDDKNYGALILENKIQRTIYVESLGKDTINFSFMPVKSGLIELEKIIFWDIKLCRNFIFQCNFKMLIN